jgi:hypothetical protein
MDTECRKHADGLGCRCTETHDCIQDTLHQGKDHPQLTGREENSQEETEREHDFSSATRGLANDNL